MWPFARKLVVDDETAAWHVDNFAWLIRQFGGAAGLARSKRVLPMPGYFIAEGEKDHAFALRIFDQINPARPTIPAASSSLDDAWSGALADSG